MQNLTWRDFIDQRVVTVRPLWTSSGSFLPTGTKCTVVSSKPKIGLKIETDPCLHCGRHISVRKVRHYDVAIIYEKE